MAISYPKTKKPTGLKITRNGNKFTFEWKCADKNYNAGQQLRWRRNIDYKTIKAPKGTKKIAKWTNVSISAGARSASITLDYSQLYPSTKTVVRSISFQVTGKAAAEKNKIYLMSDESTCTFTLVKPPVPTLTPTWDSELTNQTKFTWNVNLPNEASDHYIFRRIEWQSILVKNSEVIDGKKLSWSTKNAGWRTGVGSRNSNVTIAEDSDVFRVPDVSYTRWVRARAVTPGYVSDWRYARHTYAMPYRAKIMSYMAGNAPGSSGILCTVRWMAGQPNSHPIDKTVVQYSITTPGAGGTFPTEGSWTDAITIRDTADYDATLFYTDKMLSNDECLFIRVNTHHDANDKYGQATLIKYGALSDPSNLSVTADTETYKLTVSAQNKSSVPDSCLAIVYKTSAIPDRQWVIGIMPHDKSSVTIKYPRRTDSGEVIKIGVYAFVGTYTYAHNSTYDFDNYTIKSTMASKLIWDGGTIPWAPQNVAVTQSTIPGSVTVTWDWTWSQATSAEISWADHEDAWESTNQPSTYLISHLHASRWNISGLSAGVTWYIRVRLLYEAEATTYGPWSDIVTIDLSSAPAVPTLVLSDDVITKDGSVTATWAYTTTDGTKQSHAEICEATITDSGVTYGRKIARSTTAQSITISASKAGWQVGNTYNLCLRTMSASGRTSEWSDPVSISIAEPLTAEITSTSLVTDSDTGALLLTALPLTVNVTGAGEGGITSIVIERAEAYYVDRPDESMFEGHEGETIAAFSQDGEDEISISNDDLVGRLDDTAKYRLIAMVQDGLGQTASADLLFTVAWAHQAVIPTANVTVDNEEAISIIRPIQPSGFATGDTVDIYRLSIDKPELIIQNGSFGTQYVDPYPTLGRYGGYRIVYITKEGDYITADNDLAWTDYGDEEGLLNLFALIIDFDGDRLILPYNITISNSWEKDFQETKYLGGSVQGDWNLGVSKTVSISTDVAVELDSDQLPIIHRLATYPGICHVRTPDGSSFAANVSVSESRENQWVSKLASFTLDITKVDPEGFDGMPYSEYIEGA